ncbi:transglutaminase family protein [Algibacillus agarilyticus]|uniref:transglutaminase family protein n=1 Tax=Algibacillus agarilyticus TaxID=2234133 RepID=UPI000DCFB684|nr:DUF3488 and transglutaminase-like domain-containing protein [Algibacillus agarilyticus]
MNWLKTELTHELKLLSLFFPAQIIVQVYQSVHHAWWAILFYLICAIWRFAMLTGSVKPIGKFAKNACFITGLLLVVFTGVSTNILVSLFVMLAVAQSLKILEFETQRDVVSLFIIHLFLTASTLLFYFDLMHSLALALSLFLTVAAVIQCKIKIFSPAASLKMASQLALVSLPIALVLFFMMPQLPPLWKMAKPKSPPTGLTETVKPGDLADLAGSNKLAFRVEFEGAIPDTTNLYWRTLVHESFDGESWAISEQSQAWKKAIPHKQLANQLIDTNQNSFLYTVIAEPSHQKWLHALDIAYPLADKVYLTPDYNLVRTEPVSARMQYKIKSYMHLPVEPYVDFSTAQNLQLPADENEQARALAQKLRQQYPDDAENNELLINALLRRFNQDEYHYTLKPPRVSQYNGIDDFLFESKSGFCAHYASAFTFVVRAAGIPARVVSGYLGGEWNPQGEYLSLYQYDAHAWSEVYLQNKGWVRFDPTAFVAPDRVEMSVQDLFKEKEDFLPDNNFALVKYQELPFVSDVRFWLANVDYQWTRWIINYNQSAQENLLKRLFGQKTDWTFYLYLISFLCASIGLFVLIIWLIQRYKKQPTDVVKYYHKALKALSTQGIDKPIGATPEQLVHEIEHKAPELLPIWHKIIQLLNDIQYRNLPIKTKRKLISQLRVEVKKMQ